MPDLSAQTLDAVTRAGERAREAAISAAGSGAGLAVDPQEGARHVAARVRAARPLVLAAVFTAGYLLGRRARQHRG